MAVILNGRLPDAMLGTIPGTARRVLAQLVPQTAALRAAFAARFGKPLVVTDDYRTYEEQVRLKIEKGPYAATPGYSNHGLGRALDLGSGVNLEGSPEYLWMKANGPRFGWFHPRWAEDKDPSNGQQEPWHWEAAATAVPVSNYTQTGGQVPSAPSTGPVAPIPEEDVMASLAEVEASLARIVSEEVAPIMAALSSGPARWYKVDGGALAWLDLGTCRRRGTNGQYAADPSGVVPLPATDPFWALPVVGDAFGELYRREGQDAAWLIESDPAEQARTGRAVRRWPGRDAYLAHGAPAIVTLPASHVFWTLRPVGEAPPEGT
jgi:hypothetical protein